MYIYLFLLAKHKPLLNSTFIHIHSEVDLAPPSLAGEIEKCINLIYPKVNNDVYRCNFAQSQVAYDEAVARVFTTLNTVDDHLNNLRFLCGEDPTLADVCLFTTLIRFDVVYNTLFWCTKKRLIDYRNLYPYVRDIYQIPSVAKTCNLAAVMDGYYKTLFPLNLGGNRPVMPNYCEDEVQKLDDEEAEDCCTHVGCSSLPRRSNYAL